MAVRLNRGGCPAALSEAGSTYISMGLDMR